MVTSLPTRRRIWRSRRMWKKQTAATLAICFFIVSSESNRTPRSRTTSEGLIVVSVLTVSDRSCDDSLLMAALDSIHIASVLSAFSCNRRELHHWVTSATQSLSYCRSLELFSGLALASSCVSSAYMCGRTLPLNDINNVLLSVWDKTKWT